MPTGSPARAVRFREIIDHVAAALHQQRAIEARRALQRYRHLLAEPDATLPLNEIIPISSEKDILGDANGVAPRECATSRATFERA
ncbi:hypothetical protein JQ607_15755 [Bradyrhizobium liaoningense]|uniref:hypothetical protein n=1 Tax=Bradyrhizobium liaoningense TaxID=43992 RepID=UPI001BA7F138|nr:hypothetical protein [Bradyrhizobium liaoningense]MBR0841654.1 hypothetical protein [Bradyrhizobium liaoningense]MBR0857475.1 hypothetical protein [Bradyrhizobium liaoningense]